MAYYHDFRPVGYLSDTVPDDIFLQLKEKCFQAKNKNISVTKDLAGNIAEEYQLDIKDEVISNKLLGFLGYNIIQYQNRYEYNRKILTKDVPYIIDNMWVNFQKKHEFNPIHVHQGVFSFVIWVNIPYSLEDEFKNKSSINSNYNVPSIFQFTNRDFYGHTAINLMVDKSYEGKMILFPSDMSHCVYPFFTSDEYRISISGNISLNADINPKPLSLDISKSIPYNTSVNIQNNDSHSKIQERRSNPSWCSKW